jgi:predicted enzyme related to lactoylglutathione lyase
MPESRSDIIGLVVATRSKFFVLEYSTGLTTIATLDFDLMVKFYQQLLGKAPYSYQPDSYAGWKIPGLELGIFRPHPSQQDQFAAPSQSSRPISLCLEVADLEQAMVLAAQIGRVSVVMIASHGRECYLYDPDDNRIILHERTMGDPRPSKNL